MMSDARFVLIGLVWMLLAPVVWRFIVWQLRPKAIVPKIEPEPIETVKGEVEPIPQVALEPISPLTMDEIHEKYRELAETDPKLAGRLKYVEQLRIHGQ